MDPDEDNDSVLEGGSATGTPKRSSKKRKVEAGAGGKGAGLLAPKLPVAAGGKGGRKPARRSARGREVGLGRVGLKEWNIPHPDIGPPPALVLNTSLSISFLPRTIPSGQPQIQPKVEPVSDSAYDTAFNSVWSSIVTTAVPYAHKARANHVEAVRLVNERVGKWCASAAKRGWGGEYVPGRKDKEPTGGGRFGRDPAAKTRKLQRELLTFWKKNEKEERDERRRRERDRVEKARMELEKKEEMRQRRKLEFLITQTELYSHFVGKRLKSTCLSI
jgi:DNA-binding domain